MTDSVITYETLYELLRLETTRNEIQDLDPTFFENLVSYLKEKDVIINDESDNIFQIDQKGKAIAQLEQIKKILKKLYEKREKKITDLALLRSRTGSELVDASNLLPQEAEFFNQMLAIMDRFRNGILNNLVNGEMPIIEKTVNIEKKSSVPKITKTVKFKHAVPQFMGTDLEVFGPFDEGDIANLPESISKVLIAKERAQYIDIV